MNPEQPNNPQPPIGPTPPEQPPVAPEAPAPTFDAAPAANPQPVVAPEPVQAPVMQPVAPSAPVDQNIGAPVPPQVPAADPAVFGTAPAPVSAPVPGKNNKLVALIAAIAGGLVAVGLLVWILVAFVFNSIALETYEGDNYSVLVPKDYEKEESGSSVSFKEPDAESEEQSQVAVTSVSIEDMKEYMSRSELMKLYDETLSEKNLTKSSGFSSKNEVTNFKKEETTYQGFDARKITFDVEDDGKRSGSGYVLVVFGDDAFYIVMVAAHEGDSALAKSANKILNSLKIDE